MSESGQKFVARNRAPRVQIEYDVELYGAEKSIQLPFVMGVMADLSGKSEVPLPAVADRKFLDIDVDNFDARMRAIQPRAAFSVPNTLTGAGNLPVDLTFESMSDFSPAAVAGQVPALRALLDARTQLQHLVTYMDGKSGAEELIARLIGDPKALSALLGSGSAKDPAETASALADLAASSAGMAAPEADPAADALAALRAAAPQDSPSADAPDLSAMLAAGVAAPKANVPAEDEGPEEFLEAEDTQEEEESEVKLDSLLDDDAVEADLDAPLSAAPEGDPESDPEAEDEDDPPQDDLEALLPADDTPEDPGAEPTEPFGILTTPRPEDRDAPQSKFRIAILGDFTGRAARGALETGPALASRKPIRFDVDTIEDVIARFATTLVLPIGKDGAGIDVPLRQIDDLHPDELFENVAIFDELAALRQRVEAGDGAKAIAEMQGWADEFGAVSLTPRARPRGAAVPADRKLSDFGALIGDMTGALRTPSPAEALIARVVGPFVQAAPDPGQAAMLAAVDAAISGAMSAILHHPDFQAIESTWRSLDLLARRIETGAGLEIVLYDVSAEEWAADLSAQEDLSQSGLFQLLAEEPRLDAAQGPLSAVFGLYTLEETPPHAELMARMAKISAWMNAPFLAAISPKFLEVAKHDRSPLVAQSWDALRALPEAAHVGLAAPRFLLRLPYGAKTDPVDPFDYEEFTLREGLRGMLWANPVVLSAILMAQTVTQSGKEMTLGTVMSAGDMPFHYMTDTHGDQIALPCTERLLTTRTMADVVARGYIPLLSIKGRNEVRQGSFQALGPGMLAGPWGQGPGAATPAETAVEIGAADASPDPADTGDEADPDLSDLGLDLEADSDPDSADLDLDFGEDSGGGDEDLDALLAGFGDDDDENGGGDGEMDDDLAALLEGL